MFDTWSYIEAALEAALWSAGILRQGALKLFRQPAQHDNDCPAEKVRGGFGHVFYLETIQGQLEDNLKQQKEHSQL